MIKRTRHLIERAFKDMRLFLRNADRVSVSSTLHENHFHIIWSEGASATPLKRFYSLHETCVRAASFAYKRTPTKNSSCSSRKHVKLQVEQTDARFVGTYIPTRGDNERRKTGKYRRYFCSCRLPLSPPGQLPPPLLAGGSQVRSGAANPRRTTTEPVRASRQPTRPSKNKMKTLALSSLLLKNRPPKVGTVFGGGKGSRGRNQAHDIIK